MSRPPRPSMRPHTDAALAASQTEDEPMVGEFGEPLNLPYSYEEPPAYAPQGAMRAAMRPADTRGEMSSRERAAARAAELRDNIGDLEESVDEFQMDKRDIPDGWSYEWKRKTALGLEDPAYQVALARMGWEPVPASRHPHFMPSNMHDGAIERKGMVLMERPKEITDEVKRNDRKKALNELRTKEQQALATPNGTMERTLVDLKKSYAPMPVPD